MTSRHLPFFLLALLALLPFAAPAATEWAVFGPAVGNSQTGTFLDGRSVRVTANYSGTGVIPPGGSWTSSPIVPGQSTSANPPGTNTLTASGQLAIGAVAMTMDLTDFAVDGETLFGISDVYFGYQYRLELLDAQDTPLSLAGLQVTNFNLDLANFDFDADYNLSVDPATGNLLIAQIHDANNDSTYRHTGLALIGNLPVATRKVRIVSAATFAQNAEGVNYYLAGSASEVPVPAAMWLVAPALAVVTRFARRR
ncbi:MAG: hypothetical protein IT486_10180 [Gammaproteobacteria bacterium]|nr:hypothetical protein [Gammaproteobacteria bacterium]